MVGEGTVFQEGLQTCLLMRLECLSACSPPSASAIAIGRVAPVVLLGCWVEGADGVAYMAYMGEIHSPQGQKVFVTFISLLIEVIELKRDPQKELGALVMQTNQALKLLLGTTVCCGNRHLQ